MAIYNEILEGRFNRALQKFFSMKGRPPTPQLSGELMPVLPLFWGKEARYLEGWQTYYQLFNIAAVAANVSRIEIRNPLKSGIVAVLEKVTVSNNNVTAFNYNFSFAISGITDLGTVGVNSNTGLDKRGQNSPTLIISSDNNQAGQIPGILMAQPIVATNTNYDFIISDDQELPLLPGSSYYGAPNVVNTQNQISIWWRERAMADSEVF